MRRDMVTFLSYLNKNRVVGTQSTGNLPLKAVREICAQFVNQPVLDAKIGDKVFKLRSEDDVWPLFSSHAYQHRRIGNWRTGSRLEGNTKRQFVLERPCPNSTWLYARCLVAL